MVRGAWRATVHGVAESQNQLSTAHMENRFKDGVWARERLRSFLFFYPEETPAKSRIFGGFYRLSGEANGNPLQYPCLENPTEGGTMRAAVHGIPKSWAGLSD